MSDEGWLDDVLEYTLPISQAAKLEFLQGGMKTIKCPKCGGELNVVVSTYNQHCHGRCKTDGCLSWME